MFEIYFDCDASQADFVLLRLLLNADKHNWHTFEVNHNQLYKKARIYFYSKTDDCASTIAALACIDIEDINIRAI